MKTGIRTQLQVSPLADSGSGFSCPSNTPPQHCTQAMGDHLEIVNDWLLFSRSVVPDSVTPWTAARQAPLSFTVSQSLLKFMFIELAMLPDYLILHRPLLPPSILPSIKVFSNELAPHIRWPKYWCFSMIPSNEYSGLISFRLTGLISLQSTGLFKSLLQHHNSKASILLHSASFMVQFSHPYMTIGKMRSSIEVTLAANMDPGTSSQ